jgi:hypothetical protein
MNDPRADIVAKAVKDPKFREELKKDPASAIEKATGVKVPAGLTVKIVEDSASVVHLVLPPDPKSLSEADLKKVAGGNLGDDLRGQTANTSPACFSNTSVRVNC